ncbi:MAG TPA: hypothetical protein VM939_14790 [Gemmatimonadaceae bacterium]|nr:hypothetical protein [Gemmatimonadaceae bacterium]
MARDTALMARARVSGETVFAVYSWTRPTLSIGRNQAARGTYDAAEAARRGIDIVRRPTGGRALLHHREVTYSVTAPVSAEGTLRDTYQRINRILMKGLQSLGVQVDEADPKTYTGRPDERPCFAEPARGELITDGRKLVGSAQWHDDGALLQHGSILIDDDQRLIRDLTLDLSRPGNANDVSATSTIAIAPTAVRTEPATLKNALGRSTSVEEVAASLFDAVQTLEDEDAMVMDESDIRDAAAALVPHYESKLWTWRQ